MELRNAVVVDGVRTAFTKGGRGKLEAARLDDLGAYLIRALLERNPKVKPTMIVRAKIMGAQAGLNIDRRSGMSTARLESHFLAGGDVTNVLRAIIVSIASIDAIPS